VVIVFRFEGAQLRTEADFEVEEVYIALQKGSRISMLVRGHFVKPEGGRHEHLPAKLCVLTATVPKTLEAEDDLLACIEKYGDELELKEVEG
jgi:hypothetical protein